MGWTNIFGSKSKSLVGVDIGTSAIKVVELRSSSKGSYELKSIGAKRIPGDSIVDGVIIAKLPVAEAIDSLFQDLGIKNDSIATSIAGHSVIVKKITVPAQSRDELDDSIQWEAEQYIPFDISEVNVDYQVVRKLPDANKIEVILVAAKREKITDHTSVVSMAGKNASVVDTDAFALHNVFELNYEPQEGTVAAVLDIGATVMNINIQRGRDFLYTRDINFGGNQYTEFLQRELNVSIEEAEEMKQAEAYPEDYAEKVPEILRSVSENLAQQAQTTFDYFKSSNQSDEIEEIYIAGGASRTEGLRDYLEERFQVPVQFLDPFKKVAKVKQDIPPEYLNGMASDFAIAVGLALRTASDR
ncbi:MAG TPA: type IV pilus assembly protein PilM [Acidobacteriota bacterium]|nr:type IV pilus assembly protein PilM [Acidobacteriota bacterium]